MSIRLSVTLATIFFTFCTSVGPRPAAELPSIAPLEVPPPSPAEWRAKVIAAKALDDPAQRTTAMLALVRGALPDRDVRLSGTTHTENVHAEDNEPAPIVNFDPRLNQKNSAQPRSGGSTRSLENNFGYYFSVRGVPYVVLGPAALDPRSPVFTKLAAEHEMFHATQHVGDPRPLPDRELETWTTMFVTYFHEMRQFRQRWAPMLSYYDDAAEEERKKALERLVAYYRQPPGDEKTVRAAFDDWLARRRKDEATANSALVADLDKALAAQ